MKKYIIGFIGLLLFGNCIVSHANKNVYEFDHSLLGVKNQLVTKTFTGDALILSLLPTGNEPDLKTYIMELMKDNKCVNLKNIEIEFYQRSFILVGFPNTIISAYCIK